MRNFDVFNQNTDIFNQNTDCGYMLELPWQGSSNPQSVLYQKYVNWEYTPVLLYKSGVFTEMLL